MKKKLNLALLIVLSIAVIVCFTACKNKNKVDNSPSPTIGHTPSPSPNVSPTVGISPSPNPGETANPDEDALIEGFVEGKVVEPASVPEIVSAIENSEKHGDKTIKSITMALYEGKHAYKIVFEGEGTATETVYVYPNGEIVDEVNGAG